jgi:hypothetical protein
MNNETRIVPDNQQHLYQRQHRGGTIKCKGFGDCLLFVNSLGLYSRVIETIHVLFLKHSLFTFFLDKKSNKKIKAKRIAPLLLSCSCTSSRTISYGLPEI